MSKPFSDIYNFIGSDQKYNRIDYNEYRNYDVRYNYSFREGETQTFNVTPSSNILTDYDTIELKMYSNNGLAISWSGTTNSFTGSTSDEIYLEASTITINLSSEKSYMLVPGDLALMVKISGSNTSEYQVYLGTVYKGF